MAANETASRDRSGDFKQITTFSKGKQIPLGSRIIAICDSIDAMSSNRCYRKAHDMDFCYQEIEKNLGKMYDPEIGKAVLEHWDYVVGSKN